MQMFILDTNLHKRKKKRQVATNIVRKYYRLKKYKLQYEDFIPLHELWKEYMRSALNGAKDERLLKSDYHGCLLHVTKSDNPSQQGIHGIVLRESRNTFLLIRPRLDRLVTIPKQGTVFHFVLDRRLYTIFGDNFRTTSAGRVQKKFKPNARIPDFLDAY